MGHLDRILTAPYKGAPHTVRIIKDAVAESRQHYLVRRATELVCQGLRSKDYVSEALAVCFWVEQRTRYMRDPRTVELVRSPVKVIEQIQAGQTPCLDCDDMTALIAAMLESTGAECFAVTAAFRDLFFKGERQYSHVYCQVKEPRSGAMIVLDPVANIDTDKMLTRIVAQKIWPL